MQHPFQGADPNGRDLDLWRKVEDALWRESLYRVQGGNSVAFEVDDGAVTLWGHVTSAMLRIQIERWVQAVRGVRAVINDLIADSDLTIEVARALGQDRVTQPHQIRVGAHQGWINLAGEVPSAAVQAATEAVAASVSRVRGILTLPRVSGGKRVPGRRPLQPLPGQSVYASDGPAGRIEQVVVNPLNRLVSQVVVGTNFELGRRMIRYQVVVPAEALLHVNDGGVFLADSLKTLASRPGLDADGFQKPGFLWQPPFPYAPGTLWWPAQPVHYLLPTRPAEVGAKRVNVA